PPIRRLRRHLLPEGRRRPKRPAFPLPPGAVEAHAMSDTPPDDMPIVAPIRMGPSKSWMQRLSQGLSKSSRQLSEQVVATFTTRRLDQEALDELEEMLIEADLGPAAAARVAESFGRARFGREASEQEVREGLA